MDYKPPETFNITVIPDTNIIRGRFPVSSYLVREIEKLSSEHENLKVKILIPETVKLEWLKNLYKVTAANIDSHNVGLEGISNYFDIKNVKIEKTKKEIIAAGEKKLKELKIKTFRPNYGKINLKSLVEKAVWIEPPLEEIDTVRGKSVEKGFKDAVIAESIFEFVKGKKPNEKVAIITNDEKLRDFLEDELGKNQEVNIYSNPNQFVGGTKLALSMLRPQLFAAAMLLFFEKFDLSELSNNCKDEYFGIFKSSKIVSNHFTGKKSVSAGFWKSDGEGPLNADWEQGVSTFEPWSTRFLSVKKIDKKLSWATTLRFAQTYNLTYKSWEPNSPSRIKHIIDYEYEWTTEIKDDSELENPTIISGPKLVYETFERDYGSSANAGLLRQLVEMNLKANQAVPSEAIAKTMQSITSQNFNTSKQLSKMYDVSVSRAMAEAMAAATKALAVPPVRRVNLSDAFVTKPIIPPNTLKHLNALLQPKPPSNLKDNSKDTVQPKKDESEKL